MNNMKNEKNSFVKDNKQSYDSSNHLTNALECRAEAARENIYSFIAPIVEQQRKIYNDFFKRDKEQHDAVKESFQAYLKNFGDQLSKLEKCVTQLYNGFEHRSTATTDAGGKLDKIETLCSRLSHLLHDSELADSLAKLKNSVAETQDAIKNGYSANYQALLELTKENNDQLQEKYTYCGQRVKELEDEIITLTQRIQNLSRELDDSSFIQNRNNIQDALKSFVSTIETVEQLKAKYDSAMTSMHAYELKNESLEKEKEDLLHQKILLQQQFDAEAEKAIDLQNNLKATALESNKLLSDLSVAEQELELKKQEYEAQTKDLQELQSTVEHYRKQQAMCIPIFLKDMPLFKELDSTSMSGLFLRNSLVCLIEAEQERDRFNFNDMAFWKQLELVGRYLNSYLRVTAQHDEQYVYDQMNDVATKINDFAKSISDPAPFTLFLPLLGTAFQMNAVISVSGITNTEKILNWGVKDAKNNYQVRAKVG